MEEEIIKATSIGAKSMVADSGLFAEVHYRIALERQKEWREKKEKIDLIKKPQFRRFKGMHMESKNLWKSRKLFHLSKWR